MSVRREFAHRAGVASSIQWLAAALLFASAAQAQRAHGVVTARTTGMPVAGAVVVLVDSAATVAARALSDAQGNYSLRVAAGRYRVRAMRVGFQSITTPSFEFLGDTTIALVLPDVPVGLPAVTTRDRAECSIRPDSGLATFALWQDAKTALLATAITLDDSGYRFDAVDHSRLWAFPDDSLRDVALAEHDGYDRTSWQSRSAEQLEQTGYVTGDAASIAFVAPDVDVLLSPYFSAAHCFRVDDTAHADSLIGLRFEPAARSARIEIRGTLWLDRATHELRSLGYEYTNVPHPIADSLPGGHVDFVRLRTGAWIISDWAIRIPVESQATRRGRPVETSERGGWRRIVDLGESAPAVQLLRVTGGDLRAVRHDSVVIWRRPTGSIYFTVLIRGGHAGAGARGAIVRLLGSHRSVTTDSAGHAELTNLVPGSYLLAVSSPELDMLGRPAVVMRVDVAPARTADAHAMIEPVLGAARDACGPDGPVSETAGVVMGVVTRNGVPAKGVVVTAAWVAPGSTAAEPHLRATTSPDGIFALCGVPRQLPFRLRAGGAARPVERYAPGEVVRQIDLPLTDVARP